MALMSRRLVVCASAASLSLAAQPARGALACGEPKIETGEGPYYPVGEIPAASDLTCGANGVAEGSRILVRGTILDQRCQPLSSARIVIWQTDARARYLHPEANELPGRDPHFLYYAQQTTGADGGYRFRTIEPQPYDFHGLHRARHIHFEILHQRLGRFTTEMYFAGSEDDARRQIDEVWSSRSRRRRSALIAAPATAGGAEADDLPTYQFDIMLT